MLALLLRLASTPSAPSIVAARFVVKAVAEAVALAAAAAAVVLSAAGSGSSVTLAVVEMSTLPCRGIGLKASKVLRLEVAVSEEPTATSNSRSGATRLSFSWGSRSKWRKEKAVEVDGAGCFVSQCSLGVFWYG